MRRRAHQEIEQNIIASGTSKTGNIDYLAVKNMIEFIEKRDWRVAKNESVSRIQDSHSHTPLGRTYVYDVEIPILKA